jgi:hypothetical protein
MKESTLNVLVTGPIVKVPGVKVVAGTTKLTVPVCMGSVNLRFWPIFVQDDQKDRAPAIKAKAIIDFRTCFFIINQF